MKVVSAVSLVVMLVASTTGVLVAVLVSMLALASSIISMSMTTEDDGPGVDGPGVDGPAVDGETCTRVEYTIIPMARLLQHYSPLGTGVQRIGGVFCPLLYYKVHGYIIIM